MYTGTRLSINTYYAQLEALVGVCPAVHMAEKMGLFQFSDPDLPDALLPRDWVGASAKDTFLAYNRKLRRRAERFYCSIAAEPTIVDNDDRSRKR